MFSIDEAQNKTLKSERLQNRAPLFRRPILIEKSSSYAEAQSSCTMVDQPAAH